MSNRKSIFNDFRICAAEKKCDGCSREKSCAGFRNESSIEINKELVALILEAMEPVEPKGNMSVGFWCGACRAGLLFEKQAFCQRCGKAVKWL